MIYKSPSRLDDLEENRRPEKERAAELQYASMRRISRDSAQLRAGYNTVFARQNLDRNAISSRRRFERGRFERNRIGAADPTRDLGRAMSAVRMTTRDEALNQVNRLPLPPSIQFRATIHNNGLPEIINLPPLANIPAVPEGNASYTLRMDLAYEIALRNLRSEEEITRWLIGRNPFDLAPAISLLENDSLTPHARPVDPRHHFNLLVITEANARAIARSYKDMLDPYTEIERILSDGGVSKFNVISTLDNLEQLAQDQPGELTRILRILQGNAGSDQEVRRLMAQQSLLASLDGLSRITGNGDAAISLAQMEAELTGLQQDQRAIAGVAPPAIPPPTAWISTHMNASGYANLSAITSVTIQASVMREVTDRMKTLNEARNYYSNIANTLDAVRVNLTEAGLQVPAALSPFIGAAVNHGNIRGSISLQALVASAIPQLGIGDAEKVSAALKQAREKATKTGDRLRGLDAVKRVNEEILRINSVKGDVREIASEMAIMNEAGFQDRELMEKMLKDPEVVGERETASQKIGRQFTQLATGTQESVVVNLAEALGVQRNHGTWAPLAMQATLDRYFPTLGLGRGTRRFWLFPKMNARPAWGELGFEKLMVAFVALRKGLKTSPSAFPNTPYIRAMIEEISEILLQEHTARLLKDLGTIDQTSKKEDGTMDTSEKEEQLAHHNAKKQRAILYLYGAEAEKDYEDDAAKYLQIAQNRTATWRRATGRAIKKTAVATKNAVVKTSSAIKTGVTEAVKWPFTKLRQAYQWLRST
ncbi:MAG: hypothetical protein WCG83_02775 [Candidatus Peregrinibacteria bacterium]